MLIRGVVSSPVRGVVDAPVKGEGGAYGGFSTLKAALAEGSATLLVVGDSLGNQTNECIYLTAEGLADRYPTHTVEYRLFDDGAGAYGSPTTIQTGSGADVLSIYNASVSGSDAGYLMGGKRAAAIDAIDADAVLWNHGKNTTDLINLRGEMLNGYDMMRVVKPGVAQSYIRQLPNRDDEAMAPTVATISLLAAQYGDTAPIDWYAAELARGRPSGDYADNVHPSEAGSIAGADVILAAFDQAGPVRPVADAIIEGAFTNILANGDLSDWPGSLPVGWTIQGSAAVTKDVVIVDDGRAYSMKVVGTAAGARIRQLFTSDQRALVAGRSVMVAVRQFIPDGSAASVGRVSLSWTSASTGAGSVTSRAGLVAKGGWLWSYIGPVAVPADITATNLLLYCDTSANTDSAAYYSRAAIFLA